MQEFLAFITREFFLAAVVGGIIANVAAHFIVLSSSRFRFALSSWRDVALSVALLQILAVVLAVVYSVVVSGENISGMPIEESNIGRFIVAIGSCWAPIIPLILARQVKSPAAESAWAIIVLISWLLFAYAFYFAPQQFDSGTLISLFILLNEFCILAWLLVTIGAAILLPVVIWSLSGIKRAYFSIKRLLDTIA